MTAQNSVKPKSTNPPPIVYLIAILFLIFLVPKFWGGIKQLLFSIDKNDRGSIGEQLLIQDNASFPKKAAIKLFANKQYPEAIKYFKESLLNYPNDPETLIYLNNAQAIDNSVKIAVSVPISNNLNIAQEILRGVARSQNEINQQGGIKKAKLQIEIIDDANDPEIAKQIAADLVKDAEILAVVGHNSSNASLAAAPIYQQGKLVMVSPTSMANNLSGIGSYIFRTVPNSQVMAQALTDYVLKTARTKKMAFCIDSQAIDNVSFKDEFIAAWVSKGGQLAPTVCDLSSPNFNADMAVDWAISSGADGLFIVSHIDRLDAAIELARANRGRLPLFSTPTMYTIKTLEAGQDVKGLVLPAPWHPQTNPNFASMMARQWHGRVNWRTAMAYDATKTIIVGLQSGNTRDRLQQTLRSPNFTTLGASGTVAFTPTGDRNARPSIVQVRATNTAYDFIVLD
jgi:branched-chain amino acid transport system substrate-binding protein